MDRKIIPRIMGLGLLLGMVFTAGGEISDRGFYSGGDRDSSKVCLYQDGLAVDSSSKYFLKDTSNNICLPSDKACD